MKTVLSKENNLGTFVAFVAKGYPSAVPLENSSNSSRAAGNKSGKVCRARLKAWMLTREWPFGHWNLTLHCPQFWLMLFFYLSVQLEHLVQTHCPSHVTSCCLLSSIQVFLYKDGCHLLAQNLTNSFQFLAKKWCLTFPTFWESRHVWISVLHKECRDKFA